VINRSAAVGFERGVADYERARPSYPQAVLDSLPLRAGAVVVDLAAGTGKLTRQLAASPATVIGLEPVVAMRTVLAAFAPAVASVAETLPLRDASVDAITVAQAFHWFDAPRALAEIARVLRPGGALVMVWNERDGRVAWVDAMTTAIHRHDDGTSYTRAEEIDWPAIVAVSGWFTPVEAKAVDNVQRGVDIETVIARALSTSYVSAAGDDVRAQVEAEVRAIVGGFEEPFDFPYVTQIYTCHRH
jgi:SAM-dependent methyltransferase